MVEIAPVSLTRIAEAVGGTVILTRLGSGEEFGATQLGEPLEVGAAGVAFVISESFIKDVAETRAGALVIQTTFSEKLLAQIPLSVKAVIASPDAYLGLARLTKVIAENDLLADWRLPDSSMVSPVHSRAAIHESARIAPGVVMGEGVKIGARTLVLGNAVIGPGVAIGADCVIFPGVVLYPRVSVGDRVRIHANVVLGADGFGYARGPRGSEKIWHLGRVVVGDDVEIGAGTTIDRGTMKDTIIETGAKIDNLCQIGHNGHVGAHAILCAQVGMAGNVTVGRGAILAGKVGVADKVEIGDGALVGPMSGLSKDVKPGEQVMGQHPAKPRREWWKLLALFERLPDLYDRVKKLESRQP